MKHLMMMTMALGMATALSACMTDAPQPGDDLAEEAATLTLDQGAEVGLDPSDAAALVQLADGEATALYCEGEYGCPTTEQSWIFTCGAHNVAAAYSACKRACPVTCLRFE